MARNQTLSLPLWLGLVALTGLLAFLSGKAMRETTGPEQPRIEPSSAGKDQAPSLPESSMEAPASDLAPSAGRRSGQIGLQGRVVDGDTQDGVEGVVVWLVQQADSSAPLASALSNEGGEFQFLGTATGAMYVQAQAPDGWNTVGASTQPIPDDPATTIVLGLERGLASPLTGRLVDAADGLPVGDFQLRILNGEEWEDCTTGPAGVFASLGSYAAGTYMLGMTDLGSGFHDVHRLEHEPSLIALEDPPEVRVQIGPTFLLDLELPTGQDVDDLQAVLEHGEAPGDNLHFRYAARPVREGPRPWVRFTNSDAESAWEAGPWYIAVGTKDGLWFGWAPVPQVRGTCPDPISIRFWGFGSVAGRVIDSQGNPVPRMNLLLRPTESNSTSSRTYATSSTADGSYLIPYVLPGAYQLDLSPRSAMVCDPLDLRAVPVTALTGADVVVRPAQGSGEISGVVRSTSGTYHAPTYIGIWGGPGKHVEVQWEQSSTEWQGRFRLETVPPGKHQITLRPSPRFLEWSVSAEEVEAPQQDVEFLIEDGRPRYDMNFQVRDAQTQAEVKSYLFMVDFFDRKAGTAGGDEHSVPSLADVPDRLEYSWSLRADGYMPASGSQADLQGTGISRKIEVSLEPGWGARFIVFDDEANKALEGVTLYFDGQAHGPTGPNGHLQVRMAARPEVLEILTPGWELAPGWPVEPATGRFDDQNWESIFVGLKRSQD